MEYVTKRFTNTSAGLADKDTYSRQMAAEGYHIVSEQIEAGHNKGTEQCCLFAVCIPCVFLAGRTPGVLVVTYGREVALCPSCGTKVVAGHECINCLRVASAGAAQASSRTAQTKENVRKLERLLTDSTSGDYRFNWQSLLEPFAVPAPILEPEPSPERAPLIVRIALAVPFLGRMFPWVSRRRKAWEEFVSEESARRADVVEQHNLAVEDWRRLKESFHQEQIAQIDERRSLYENRVKPALLEYWTRILEIPIFGGQSKPARFVDYSDTEGKLLITYALPTLGEIPQIDEVRFLQRDNKIIEVPFSSDRRTAMYRELIIGIALVVMYRLFQSDTANALNLIAFNGTVDTIDRATGREASPCVIAMQAAKSDLMSMNFSLLETSACLSHLGGEVSKNLAELSPIIPISR